MADNYTVTQGSGTTMASDDVGGTHYPIVKLAQGALDSATLVSSTNPLPVTSTGGAAHDAAVSGNPVLMAGKASAAAPADVSGDGDVVSAWRLRNGAEAVVVTAAGALISGDATYGLDVDVVRLPALAAGTNNIGDVDVLTMPAQARTTDTVSAAIATDAIMSGTTALTPKFAAIAAANSGNNTLVAAVASKKIRVLSIMGIAAGAVSMYFTSGAGGTVIFGGSTNKIALASNGGFVLPFNPVGWFENSSTNQALVLNLSSAVAFSGGLVYVEV